MGNNANAKARKREPHNPNALPSGSNPTKASGSTNGEPSGVALHLSPHVQPPGQPTNTSAEHMTHRPVAAPIPNRPVDLPKNTTRSFDTTVTGELSDIFQFYSIDRKELGHGHYGVVRTGTNRETGKKVAIKTIAKAKVSRPEALRREIQILKSIEHPNIIKLYEAYEDPRYLHLVTELCTGGELFDRIIAKGHYTEQDASKLIRCIVDSVRYCHERDICHRDLKPENFLFETSDENANLKVIDFGLSRVDDGGATYMTTRVGTPYYIAPEVLGRHYDKSCDLWSIGVILYILLCGYPPFYGDSDPEIFASVRSGIYTFDTPEWKNVSQEAKDLINHLLRVKPSERLTAEEALQHPWLSEKVSSDERLIDHAMIMKLKRFNGHNKLVKTTLGLIAEQLTETEINQLKMTFQTIDKDHDGVITISELSEALHSTGHGILEDEAIELLKGLDIDGDGKVDYQEFTAATMKRNLFIKEQYMQNAFNYFDRQKLGVISLQDLVEFTGSVVHAKEIMDEVDTNKDGQISFQEFVNMMKKKGFEEATANEEKDVDGTGIFQFKS